MGGVRDEKIVSRVGGNRPGRCERRKNRVSGWVRPAAVVLYAEISACRHASREKYKPMKRTIFGSWSSF